MLFTQNAAVKDAALPQMLKHIDQLKPLLQANEDVILSVQIGFIGVWGKFTLFVFLKVIFINPLKERITISIW